MTACAMAAMESAPRHRSAHANMQGDGGPAEETLALRILVVDDNRDAADSLALLLSLGGHTVRAVYDGHAVEPTLLEWPADAVFVDIGMPGMDGWSVARALRNPPTSSSATLIALSGWGAPEDVQRSIDAGFDLHLTKPAMVEALDQAVNMIAARIKR